MESLADIRLFVEAASLGGLSVAGRKLGLSPAAASARLVRLETTLNTRLFERTTRKLRLTEEGRTYLEHCQLALQALDDAHAALQAGRSVVRGKVRISATSDFGRHVLKGWLDAFSAEYPDVLFSMVLSDSLSDLLQDNIDLAIRFGVPPDSSFIAKPLAPNRRLLCASPAYLASHGVPQHPGELERFDFIVLGTGASSAHEWRFRRKGETETFTVPLAKARETNDGALAREWAVDGYGLVMKSIWDVGADLKAGRLAVVLPEWRTPHAPVHALYPRSHYMAPRVRVLLDFLAQRFSAAADEFARIVADEA
ncbi:LysR family transcriptional regulator [Paraburkholderia oxyphila]|uniref:LysR family transcriptional regulator n=1 Tax=Paraburkholderia oxyphila TaxID=614212 RepID=UPI0005BBD2AA|nr:LysR family transcriptional regulator [Paraburkholderia oxyphila]